MALSEVTKNIRHILLIFERFFGGKLKQENKQHVPRHVCMYACVYMNACVRACACMSVSVPFEGRRAEGRSRGTKDMTVSRESICRSGETGKLLHRM